MSQSTPAAPHAPTLGAAIEALRDKAGAIIAFGVLLIVFGVAALAFSFFASLAAITTNGVFFVLAGAAEIVLGMRARNWRRFTFWIVGGVLYVATGLICILIPVFALHVLTLLFGAGLVAAGVVRFILVIGVPLGQARMGAFLAALVSVLLGAVILANWPMDSRYVLGTLLGVDLLFHGAGWAVFGMALRARR